MEYDFIHDVVTGQVKARFSLEHQVIGFWLETELTNNPSKLENVLTAVDLAIKGGQQEQSFVGQEYMVTIERDDVFIQSNASLSLDEELPNSLEQENMGYDIAEQASCGLEDFRQCLLMWAKFAS